MEEQKHLPDRNLGAAAGPEIPVYEGKEVIQGAERYKETTNLTTIPQPEEARYLQQWQQQTHQQPVSEDGTPPKNEHPERGGWDLGRHSWVIIAVLAALVIIAAIGGGVGGGIAVQCVVYRHPKLQRH
jgi:hypothetical protein